MGVCCTVVGIGTVVEKIYQKKRIVTIVLARCMLEVGNESKPPQIPGMMLWVEIMIVIIQLLQRGDVRRKEL